MRRLYAIVTAAFLAVPSLHAAGAVSEVSPALDSAVVAEAGRLIGQLRREAREIRFAVSRLESFARNPNVSWYSHAVEWEAVKERLAAMRDPLLRLESLQDRMLPEQKQAFERIAASAAVSASRTEAAIRALNERKGYPTLAAGEYLEAIRAIGERARMMQEATRPAEVWARSGSKRGAIAS